jgi:hypothetical protein
MPLLFSPVCRPTHLLQFFYLQFAWGDPTFLWSVPHFSHFYKPSPLQAHWGRWCHTHLLQLFIYSSHGECPSPSLRWSMPHFSRCYKLSPLQAHWGRWCHTHLLWSACLFTLPWGTAPPPLSGAEGTPPSFLHVFFYSAACLLFRFFLFFPGWGSVCPEGYSDLAQGCLWEYHVLLSSHGGLLLPSRLGAHIWWRGSPPGFSI